MINKIKTGIKIILFLIFVILFKGKKAVNVDILIIRMDAIGDAILWLKTAKYYKEFYPNKRITLICNVIWKDIAIETNFFDEVIPIEVNRFEKDLLYRIKFLRKVKKVKYDKIISPVYSRTFFGSDWLLRSISSKEKIGSIGNNSNISKRLKKISDKWYTKLIEAQNVDMFELRRNFEFISNLFGVDINSRLNDLGIDFDKYTPKELINKEYCVIFLGASTLRRAYPIEKIIDLVQTVPQDMNIVLSGSKTEEELSNSFIENYLGNHSIINFTGKTNLIESFSIIKNAKFLIGNETASVHMATAVKTPSLCFLGGGHFGRFMPYDLPDLDKETKKILPKAVFKKMECFDCNWNCKYPLVNGETWKCIYDIEVEEAKTKLMEIMEENDIR